MSCNQYRSKRISYCILLVTILMYSFACSSWHEVKMRFLIPEGYEGLIMIAWDQKDGVAEQKEGEFELYQFPSNGLLRSQQKSRNLNILDLQCYTYNLKNGRRTKLHVIDPTEVTDTVRKSNQYYIVGLRSTTDKGIHHTIFYLTRSLDSKFMQAAYRDKYTIQRLDLLYGNKD
jgi:hypothetical protein